jgi:hypothetical protein
VAPERIKCNTRVRWEASLNRYAGTSAKKIAELWKVTPDPEAIAKGKHLILGYLVRSYYDQTQPHNMGVVRLRGRTYQDGGVRRSLLLFHSAVATSTDGTSPCFESLLRHGGVRHVVNLYGGSFPFQDMIELEKRLAAKLGASYFDAARAPELAFRPLVERPEDYAPNARRAMANLARLIREQLLRPGGAAPRGNLYVHCGGGMHRSGMLVGVIRRCINRDAMAAIEADYRRHVGYVSERDSGGYELLNIRFIREFDCGLLAGAGPG